MAGAVGEVHIRGLAELEKAFLELRKEVLVGIKPALLELAKPVASDASSRADKEISNIGSRWDQFRIGATVKGVYVAPRYRRRSGSPRHNLAPLLATAMQEAVDAHQEEIVRGLDLLIAASSRRNGFTTI